MLMFKVLTDFISILNIFKVQKSFSNLRNNTSIKSLKFPNSFLFVHLQIDLWLQTPFIWIEHNKCSSILDCNKCEKSL